MSALDASWIALIISLPTRNATVRMRVWRSLKALGCGVLRDGVYLLPEHGSARDALEGEARAVVAAGGTASLVAITPADPREDASWRRLFDRTAEYAQLTQKLRAVRAALKPATAAGLARKLNGLRRSLDETGRVDFFPGEAREQAAALLEDISRELDALVSPGEPRAVAREIPRLRREDYRNRVWATRCRPWVDRLASAWLIVRFIDAEARFLWLGQPQDCPPHAIGFDFDGATFTHIGSRVTFEVLLASFGLAADPALGRIAGLVHYLGSILVLAQARLHQLRRAGRPDRGHAPDLVERGAGSPSGASCMR
jgi:hypothetical protein